MPRGVLARRCMENVTMNTRSKPGAWALAGLVGATLTIGAAMGILGGCEKKAEPAPQPAAAAPAESTPKGGAVKAPDAAKPAAPAGAKGEAGKETITIGVIAKSNENPVFQAARTGALDAAAQLSKDLGVEIKVLWQTPTKEDAQKQAENINFLVSSGVDGIAVSASDPNLLKSAVDAAVEKGVFVATFDSDVPDSKRFVYYGIDDVEAGREVMRQLAKVMGDKGGPIAILAGNQNATNLQARVKGVQEELEKLKGKGYSLKKVVYHRETAADAAAQVQQEQNTNPDIAGWAMVGGWPLFTQNALDGVYDKAKIVSVDHLPQQLDYVKKGQVAALIGQDCYGWGYQSVVYLVDKIRAGKTPANVINTFKLQIVTKDNVADYEGTWNKWLSNK